MIGCKYNEKFIAVETGTLGGSVRRFSASSNNDSATGTHGSNLHRWGSSKDTTFYSITSVGSVGGGDESTTANWKITVFLTVCPGGVFEPVYSIKI